MRSCSAAFWDFLSKLSVKRIGKIHMHVSAPPFSTLFASLAEPSGVY